MKNNFLIFCISLSILTLTLCKGQEKNEWIEDLNYLSEHLPQQHIDFYKLIDSVEFENEINHLINIIDSLDDYEVVFGIQKILASMHVAHTLIPIQRGSSSKILPIRFELFDDGLFIIGVDESRKGFIGKKVIAINNIPLDKIYKRLEPLVSYENEFWLKRQIPDFINNTKILEYVNVIEKSDLISFQLDNNESFDLSIQHRNSKIIYSSILSELTWLKNQHKNYWFDTLANDVLYIQYNKCSEDKKYSFEKFITDISLAISDFNIRTVIIDLRLNGGGSSEIIKPLIHKLQEYQDIKFYTAISKRTFSSGRIAAINLKEKLGSELIGQSTGGSPKSYGWNEHLILPNSKLAVNYCIKYFSLMDTDKDFIEPDINTDFNSNDVFTGKDLVLDYIVNK